MAGPEKLRRLLSTTHASMVNTFIFQCASAQIQG
jgi:hypothetical protein